MEGTFLLLAIPVAVVAAIRSTWSPCGLSMLSSITPMTEAGRGNRFTATACWFVAGAVAGGLTLGLVAAGGAAVVAAVGLSTTTLLAVGAVIAALTAAVDLGAFGAALPIFKRQVDDAWLRLYRPWAYGAGFGWQIGVGVATYIMTTAVFLTIVLAVLSASPAQALAVGATFGLVRGSTVFLARSATTPAALGRVHERLDATGHATRVAAAGVQVIAAAVLGGLAWHPLAAVAVLAATGLLAAVRLPGLRPASS
ncbi:MAG: hypothetical protein JWM47_847 [Acidimicrobiales bacterium]|nr:hypothetical protein [Acidimicrobiales bacterium]